MLQAATFAGLVASAYIRQRQTDSDFFFTEYDIARPEGDGFETCVDDDCASDSWRAIADNEGGSDICGSFSASVVGYRIAGDNSSSVIYQCDDSVQPLIVHFHEDTVEMSVFWIHTISQTWPSSGSNKRDFAPLPFQNRVISASNIECRPNLPLSIEVTDANGVTQNVNGTDDIRVDVPEALPANVTVSVDGGASFAEMVVTGDEKVLVSFGNGQAPTVSTGYNLQMQICPD
ncbi:hypothetical protein VKT23_009407 [Stygiomarasmius scandens]|uniref:Uncharacterized protein n=1 Tax=Marasmiellus scandens TaxID=2682957 RepID=A0ABR1JG65_9AGAR